MPEIDRQVLVTLQDGSRVWACWSGLDWYVEMDGDAGVSPLGGIVVSWSYD